MWLGKRPTIRIRNFIRAGIHNNGPERTFPTALVRVMEMLFDRLLQLEGDALKHGKYGPLLNLEVPAPLPIRLVLRIDPLRFLQPTRELREDGLRLLMPALTALLGFTMLGHCTDIVVRLHVKCIGPASIYISQTI